MAFDMCDSKNAIAYAVRQHTCSGLGSHRTHQIINEIRGEKYEAEEEFKRTEMNKHLFGVNHKMQLIDCWH